MIGNDLYSSMQVRIVVDYEPVTMPAFRMIDKVGVGLNASGRIYSELLGLSSN